MKRASCEEVWVTFEGSLDSSHLELELLGDFPGVFLVGEVTVGSSLEVNGTRQGQVP